MPQEQAPRTIHIDRRLIALFKPGGMHVFGAGGKGRESLCEWLLGQMPELEQVGPPAQPAIAHRLDFGTSGLVLAARDEHAYGLLRKMFGSGLVEKTYLALSKGRLENPRLVDVPLGSRYRRSRKVVPVRTGQKLRGVRPAVTEVVPLAHGDDCTLCRVVIRTGVRHQIRAHLALLGHPIWGDVLYGGPRERNLPEGAFMLHAFSIALELPWAGRFEQRCPPPGCFVDVLRGLDVTLEPDCFQQMKE